MADGSPAHTIHPIISIALVPSFPGLRHFPQGCGFKQWTGDDLKALMKVSTTCYEWTTRETRLESGWCDRGGSWF